MSRKFRIALAQINPVVGDIDGNTSKILDYLERAKDVHADLVAFPELSITGYPPEDLLFKSSFIEANQIAMECIMEASKGIAVVVGYVERDVDLFNAAALGYSGNYIDTYRKMFLPNYGVFDEERYFKKGSSCPVYKINGTEVGINICEDIWYPVGPTSNQRNSGAELIVNINASPFYAGKREDRELMISERAVNHQLHVAYVNTVGGQDELVFDGATVVFDCNGHIVARGKSFEEDLIVTDLDMEMVPVLDRTKLFFDEKAVLEIGSPRKVFVSDFNTCMKRGPLKSQDIAENTEIQDISIFVY